MASTRKKQDEKNLKTLRELVTINLNKQCFDCYQRGPTYVNMTIGSFVCTKCSGILRGITPPHRVKSISMATFTADEIDFIKANGNDKCKETWMGLYDGTKVPELKDEQQLKEYMSDKYEKKRFYLDPSMLKNNTSTPNRTTKPNSLQLSKENISQNMFTPDFEVDFSSAEIFNSTQSNNNVKQSISTNQNNNNSQASFANFDSNPIYNAGMPVLSNSVSGFPNNIQIQQSNTNGMFPSQQGFDTPFNNVNYNGQQFGSTPHMFSSVKPQMYAQNQQQFVVHNSNSFHTNFPLTNNVSQQNNFSQPVQATQDRYAALKDLDLALKSQTDIATDSVWTQKEQVSNKSQLRWDSSSFNQAFEQNTLTTNPFNVKQTNVQTNPWGLQQHSTKMNPFQQNDTGYSQQLQNGGPSTTAGTSLFENSFQQQKQHSNDDINTYFGQSNIATTAIGSNGKVNGSSQSNGMKNGQLDWAANPFVTPQIASNNPFL